MFSKWWHYALALLVSLGVVGSALAGLAAALIYPNLPPLEALTDYKPKLPLRVYTADGGLIGEFGEERRSVVHIADVPPVLKQAILAAEDERFYEHPGIDPLGIVRAAIANVTSGGRGQGASTITMQVARNFFLSREKTFNRKLYEILLALKIERSLSKDEILELYLNQIYLGQRSYGFAVAAKTYFGKSLGEITLPEAAMLAGLPKAPSAFNPIVNPARATLRQRYVLRRMVEAGFIDEAAFRHAIAQPVTSRRATTNGGEPVLHGDYVAEMARQIAVEQFGDRAYELGISIITTITRKDQEAAYAALREGVADYDRRHGYRGPEGFVDLPAGKLDDEQLDDLMGDAADYDDLLAALVLATGAFGIDPGQALTLGIVAVGVAASPWLLVFSMFLFASLSFAKRQTEILRLAGKSDIKTAKLSGRGYFVSDAPFILAMGVSAGMASIVIMVLYLTQDAMRVRFYDDPVWLWGIPAFLFLWLSRIWMLCQRGELDDDPVVFAVRDRKSLILCAGVALCFAMAWLGMPH